VRYCQDLCGADGAEILTVAAGSGTPQVTFALLAATMGMAGMIKRLLVAVVGMAMGGLVGLLVAFLGAGNAAILWGAALGGLVFAFAAPRAGRAA
jgi:hypothetical protein